MTAGTDFSGIGDLITMQFEDLLCNRPEQRPTTTENEQVYTVQDIAFTVCLSREWASDLPNHAVFCGGKRAIDNACVTIEPANEDAAKAVTDYFLNQKRPPLMGSPGGYIYDRVTIISGGEERCILPVA